MKEITYNAGLWLVYIGFLIIIIGGIWVQFGFVLPRYFTHFTEVFTGSIKLPDRFGKIIWIAVALIVAGFSLMYFSILL